MKNTLLHTAIHTHLLLLSASVSHGGEMMIFWGTYTSAEKSQGIYMSRLNDETGKLTEPTLVGKCNNPSFLAIAPNRKILISVSEIGGDGEVVSFSIDETTGMLTELSRQPSRGGAPCHVNIDQTGRAVVVANYSGGSVTSYQLSPEGQLSPPVSFFQHEGTGPNPKRQTQAHAHSANISPDNKYVYVSDLGIDKILTYQLNPETAALEPAEPLYVKMNGGSGPRHLAFHPVMRLAYSINELDNTITVLSVDGDDGRLSKTQTVSSLPAGYSEPNTTAHIEVHPNGKFLYGSNRGHNSIAVLAIDQETGWLRRVDHTATQGKTPRNFSLSPDGKWLVVANQDSDKVIVFKVDATTGKLTPADSSITIGRPVCVRFLPAPGLSE